MAIFVSCLTTPSLFSLHFPRYFRDSWNVFDFLIVSFGIALLVVSDPAAPQLGGLRVLRVLRPLRSITRLEGLKVIVNSLLASLPLLGNTLIVVAFYFLIFGIVGVQLWHGTLRYRCYWDGGNATNLTGPVPTRACVAPGSGAVGQWGDGSAVKAGFLPVLNTTLVEGPRYDAALFDEGFVCMGNPGNNSDSDDWVVTPPRGGCPVNHSCLCYGENPNFGLTSFDDMNFAFLNIFTYMTLEGWAEAMYVGRGR